MKKITVIGEILVEIMADHPGRGFLEPLHLTGPYPSGAPAIFASQAARLGQPCAMIAAVGADDFGRLNLNRLTSDGVDTSAIATHPTLPTGTAFVCYRPDGNRDFVFNIAASAAGTAHLTEMAHKVLNQTHHLHVMGSSLFSPALLKANLQAIAQIKSQGGSVSFDPNLRPELMANPETAQAMVQILSQTDLYLPSGPELTLLTNAKAEPDAITELLTLGPSAIILKRGVQGASYFNASETHHHPAFPVTEIDPTGAGDCFGATFIALWLRGQSPAQALRHACAAGALAVTKRGPMEGASPMQTLENLINP